MSVAQNKNIGVLTLGIQFKIIKGKRLEEKKEELEDRIEQTITLIMIELEEIAHNIAPMKTGELRISHQWAVSRNKGVLMNPLEYLQWVIRGRGWVFPVHKKALYWDELKHPVAYARPAPPNDYFSAMVMYVDAEGIIQDSFIRWLTE